MSTEHTILVAFGVEGDTELEAALALSVRLGQTKLVSEIGSVVTEWWMPNHPSVDGSDHESVAVFHDVVYTDYPNDTQRQREADATLRAWYTALGKPHWAPEER